MRDAARREGGVTCLSLLMVLFCWSTAGAGERHVSWFRLGEEGARFWTMADDPASVADFSIIPRNRKITKQFRKVFVLVDRGSECGEAAIDRILAGFREKGIDAVFTVARFEDGAKARDGLLRRWRPRKGRNPFDLIFSVGSQSTGFVAERYSHTESERPSSEMGSIPVVSVCSADPVLMGWAPGYTGGTRTNIAFTSLAVPVELLLKYLLDLDEHLRTIAIVYEPGDAPVVRTEVRPLSSIARKNGIGVIEVPLGGNDLEENIARTMPEIMDEIEQRDPTSAHSIIWLAGTRGLWRQTEVMNGISGRVPVLGSVVSAVKEGDRESATISIGVGFERAGGMASSYATGIITGTVRPGSLPVGRVNPPDIAINFRRADAIGLKVPFTFFESASTVVDLDGSLVKKNGKNLLDDSPPLR